MGRLWVGFHLHLTLAMVVAASGGGAPAREGYVVPRTIFGHPDLQGVWSSESLTPIERPPQVEHLVADPDEAESVVATLLQSAPEVRDPDFDIHDVRALAKVRGEYRTSVIVEPKDGRLPYTEAGLELVGRVRASFLGAFDDPEQRPLPERCLASFGFAPMRAVPIFIPQKIHQTEEHVLILTEDAVGLRTIHLHGEPPPDELRTIEGYSRGHWEGDTLVVETTHLRAVYPARFVIGLPIVISPETRVVERFTRVSPDEIVYRYVVNDEGLYTKPWTGEMSLNRHDGPLYEYACHEGNYSMPHVLRGGQMEADRRAKQQKPP